MDRRKIIELMRKDIETTQEATMKGYMCRCLVIATMPHSKPKLNEFIRTNGRFKLNMIAPSEIGLPYGTKPRLIMAYISREAVFKRNREIILGRSLSEFMGNLGLESNGRPILMVKNQMKRLFNTSISYAEYNQNVCLRSGRFGISSKEVYFWEKGNPTQQTLWESCITLTEEFYKEIITNPVAIDMKALQQLKESSLALDIYCWLTYRMSYLEQSIEIPWESLMLQFGCEYTASYHFKEKFLRQLKKVIQNYPKARVSVGKYGLILTPSLTHIPRNPVDK